MKIVNNFQLFSPKRGWEILKQIVDSDEAPFEFFGKTYKVRKQNTLDFSSNLGLPRKEIL